MRKTSTWRMSTLGKFSSTSVITASYYRTNDTIFKLASKIDEDIATEDALNIYDDGGDINAEGY